MGQMLTGARSWRLGMAADSFLLMSFVISVRSLMNVCSYVGRDSGFERERERERGREGDLVQLPERVLVFMRRNLLLEVFVHEREEVVGGNLQLPQHQSLLGRCRLNSCPLRVPIHTHTLRELGEVRVITGSPFHCTALGFLQPSLQMCQLKNKQNSHC